VLNAADPLVAAMADHCPGTVVFFGIETTRPSFASRFINANPGVFMRDRMIVLRENGSESPLIEADALAFLHHGVPFLIENALAATAVAWRLGIDLDLIRNGLKTFRGDSNECPARFNVLSSGASTVVVDYAHNPSAVAALVAGLDGFPQKRRTI